MPKRRPFKPGYYDWTREDFKMISWCINNSIACCVINDKTVMLTKNGKTFVLTQIKNPNVVSSWYTINGKYYA
jgi:hypothetical protein